MLGIGLAIGTALGAGGMYLALSTRTTNVVVGVDVDVDVDDPAKPAPPKKRTRRGRTAPTDAAPDTRLVWKGEPVEKPPASVDMAAGGDARSLDGGEIQAAI